MRAMLALRRFPKLLGVISTTAVLALGASACGGTGSEGNGQQDQSERTVTDSDGNSSTTKTTLTTVTSEQSFDETVSSLKRAVSDNGMMVLGEVNQAGALRATGLQLDGAHSFFVGNPSAGKKFFGKTAEIGSVVPMRFHVWAGDDGTAHVSYFDPKPLFTAVDPQLSQGGQKMSTAASEISDAVRE